MLLAFLSLFLAAELCYSVDILRVFRRVDFKRLSAAAAENIVGADIDELCADFFAGEGNVSRAVDVDFAAGVAVIFCFVDCGIGGAVYDGVGAQSGDIILRCLAVRDVELFSVRADGFIPEGVQAFYNIVAELSVGACDEYLN